MGRRGIRCPGYNRRFLFARLLYAHLSAIVASSPMPDVPWLMLCAGMASSCATKPRGYCVRTHRGYRWHKATPRSDRVSF